MLPWAEGQIKQASMQFIQRGRKTYEAPKVEVIEIETQGVLCVSGDAAASAGGGTTNMNVNNGYGW